MTPTVSIIVRTIVGREAFLREALESLAAQTFRDFEVIVVEDGSATAADTVAAFAARGLAVMHHPLARVGRCVAGNTGLALARGAFCGFLDDDDQLLPQHLDVLAGRLAAADAAVPAVYALAETRETVIESHAPLVYHEKPGRVIFGAGVPFWPTMLQYNLLAIQSVLFRRDLFVRFGGFNPELDHFEDWDLWLRYAQAGMFVSVPEVTSFYRLSGAQGAARERFCVAERYLPMLMAASQDYRWPVALGDLRQAQGRLINRAVLRQQVWRWLYRSAFRARVYEAFKCILRKVS